MNVYVPMPYEDELLYSLCMRYVAEFDASPHLVIKELFGTSVTLSPYLPREIEVFSHRTELAIGMTKEEIWGWHTMYPFLCTYMSEERVKEATERAFSGKVATSTAGLLSGFVPPKHLRWCPDCVVSDRIAYGETYWHRIHQLPGVWQCDKHEVELVDSVIPRYAVGRMHWSPAEVVVPQDVSKYRKASSSSPPETLLRRNLVELLSAPRCTASHARPCLDEAAIRAGFISPHGIDYRGLYESFAEYWGGVIKRLETSSNQKIMGQGWLHAQANGSRPIWHPVIRGLLTIFFSERHGILLDEILQSRLEKKQKTNSKFYCPNPYAEHGPGYLVKRTERHPGDSGLVRIKCDCGLYVTAPITVRGRHFSMREVVNVTRYGDSWIRKFEFLRAQGLQNTEIANELGVSQATITYWSEPEPSARRMPKNGLDAARREWLDLLGQIYPLLPGAAASRNPGLYARLLRYDSAWLKATGEAYKRKHNLATRRGVDWARRDEEYNAAILSAASRLQRMDEARVPSATGILHEAGINLNQLTRNGERLPITTSTLARLSRSRSDRISMRALTTKARTVFVKK